MQRLVIHKVVDFKGARIITDTLWMLMEAGIEEVKILQTITLLLTSSHVVQVARANLMKRNTVGRVATIRLFTKNNFGSNECLLQHDTLAKNLVICFRLNFTKDHTTNAIAGATVRQLVPVIFERISGQAEERQLREEPSPQFAQLVASILPKDTDPFVVDAYLMFQDIVVSKRTT